ncbi:MAG: DUF192 domain-containing protein [Candidatus Hadarchaeales archaeon]
MRVVDEDTGYVLAEKVEVVEGFWKRLRGQILRKEPATLLFKGGSLHVHTCLVRFPLDLLFLKDGRAIKVVRGMKPWRFCLAPKGSEVLLEFPPGTLKKGGVRKGHSIKLEGTQKRRVQWRGCWG